MLSLPLSDSLALCVSHLWAEVRDAIVYANGVNISVLGNESYYTA